MRHIGQKRSAFKCVGNFNVTFADDLVNGFLPRGIDVAAFFDVYEELAKAHQGDVKELFWHLKKEGLILALESWTANRAGSVFFSWKEA